MPAVQPNIYVDAAKTTVATPQQIYDAFMSGKVVLNFGDVSASGTTQSEMTCCKVFGTEEEVVGIIVYYDNLGSSATLHWGDTSGGE